MSITLFCLIKENTTANAFSVKISRDEPISELKKTIKAEKAPEFDNFPARRLKLWKVEIGGDHLDDQLNNLKLYDSDELFAMSEIGDYWTEKPPMNNIHVIVGPPASTATSDEVLKLREEVASLNAGYVFGSLKRKVPPVCHDLPYTPRQSGAGGTKYGRTEGDRVGNYEGIDLNSSDICSREQTIQKLVDKIFKVGFLLVRSPPMSGKTSLGQLLEQHLVKNSSIRVIRISLIWMGIPTIPWTFEEEFQRLMGITWKKFHECVYIKTIFIVDEVQMLYVPQGEPMSASHHNGDVFWETIKGCQQGGNFYIVAFAAYGYKGAWDLSSATRTMDVSPFAIPSENTWGIEDVYFTKDEYKEYFLRFCSTHFREMKDKDNVTHLQDYVYNATAGHPGLVAFFMDHIKDHFSPQGFRGYLYVQHLTQEEKDLCDMIFRGPIDIRLLDDISEEETSLVKTNLLSEQNGKLDFALPYLRALYLQRRWRSTTRAIVPPRDFKSFLRGTFANMNAETLRNSYCVDVDGRLLERAWQMEFYRAATQTLPLDIFISPDVGTYLGTSGYIDFFVDDDRSWGIELLRDGQDASGHKSRFESIYKPIRKACKEWAIIDIRNPELRYNAPDYEGERNWINVYFQEGWKSVIIEDKNEKVTIQLMGVEKVPKKKYKKRRKK
ncbi:hypothetical protein RclHR1_05150009 [Rhizophagus clarus]|uniref:Crinkler effector protein N-terminal domain-containing protein n=1 Tax=Rhizophagus clarus TaxID=94130 RepID=A0A2Z6SEL7_9GLOM|nr:hypothetical protein RclHR1_05150009 [Rhizophagus clarus]